VILKGASFTSWKVTRPVVLPSRAATVATRLSFRLRGKILNVEKAMEHKIYENEEIRNMYTALGVTVGTPDDPKALNLVPSSVTIS
jgi:hypothetical protein